PDNPPLRLPIGVRTASTITGWTISVSLSRSGPVSLERVTDALLLDRDGLFGAEADGLLDARPELLARLLVEHAQHVVVAQLEDLGGDAHAQGIALAHVHVDHHSHAPHSRRMVP